MQTPLWLHDINMNSILVITVLYNQPLEQSNVYKTLLKDCRDVFIYDNSPVPQVAGKLPERWRYVSDTANPGLSKAYNVAAEFAASNGFEWLLITDQDTQFPENAMREYELAIKKNPGINMILPKVRVTEQLYLSPVKLRHYMPKLSKSVPTGEIRIKDYAIINSGVLVNVRKFLECGGYNEKVFLDFSDFQFVERFGNLNSKAYVAPLICKQDFSDITQTSAQKINRFRLACSSIRNYESASRSGGFFLSLVILKRMLSLSMRLRSFKPIGIAVTHYFTKKRKA